MSDPNIVEKAKNLTNSVINWAYKDGFSRVSIPTFYHRKQFCMSCPHWDSSSFIELGKCKLCGCSVGKLYIPSSKCPDHPPRWINVQASYTSSSASLS